MSPFIVSFPSLTFTLSVVFQWSISYMISPDAADLGLKAIYVWAGLLVPTTIILYLFYPEVSPVSDALGIG